MRTSGEKGGRRLETVLARFFRKDGRGKDERGLPASGVVSFQGAFFGGGGDTRV
jgi:hypothetical protein